MTAAKTLTQAARVWLFGAASWLARVIPGWRCISAVNFASRVSLSFVAVVLFAAGSLTCSQDCIPSSANQVHVQTVYIHF